MWEVFRCLLSKGGQGFFTFCALDIWDGLLTYAVGGFQQHPSPLFMFHLRTAQTNSRYLNLASVCACACKSLDSAGTRVCFRPPASCCLSTRTPEREKGVSHPSALKLF